MKTSKSSVTRLYSYREALLRLKYLGFVKVFSENMADAIGATAVQVRKDFSLFGLVGNKRGGYQIDELIQKLDVLLGKDKKHPLIVVGSGNIGRALMNYKGFLHSDIRIVAAFDTDEQKVNRSAEVPTLPIGELKDFVKKNKIKVGILAVPELAAQQVFGQMMAAGIKGILNFAPVRLNVPEKFVVHNVNLGRELETIFYFVNAWDRQEQHESHKA
jgi:redox-sensing transcriptional repressor